jgi:hypothetical protein
LPLFDEADAPLSDEVKDEADAPLSDEVKDDGDPTLSGELTLLFLDFRTPPLFYSSLYSRVFTL